WRLSAITMNAVIGARRRVQSFVPSVWGSLGATYPLSQHFTLAAAAGAEPARIGLGLPASGFVSVALRVRPWRTLKGTDVAQPSAFVVQAADTGYRITYTTANATAVELS